MRSYFRQLLLEKRRQQLLKAGKWVPWKLPKLPAWSYPMNVERRYSVQIQRTMREFALVSAAWVRDNLPRLIQAQASRHHTDHQDGVNDDLIPYRGAFHEVQVSQFGSQATGYTAKILQFGTEVANYSKKQWAKIMGAVLGHEYYPAEPWLQEVTQEWADGNHQLIKSLSDEYITKSNLLLQEGILSGQQYPQLTADLLKLNKNLTVNRAKLIATDQVGKLNGRLAMHRQLDAGLSLYTWETAGDERVRQIHRSLDHQICKWSDSTVYRLAGVWLPRTGNMDRSTPGQPIRCRCIGLPFFEPMLQDIDQELSEDPELANLSQ